MSHVWALCGAWALENVGLVVTAHRLSCSVACGILVSGPGIKLMLSALQRRFFTIGPSVMVSISFFFLRLHSVFIFIFGCTELVVHRLSLAVVSRGYSFWGAPAPHCCGFSCGGTWALGMWASVLVARGLLCAASVV